MNRKQIKGTLAELYREAIQGHFDRWLIAADLLEETCGLDCECATKEPCARTASFLRFRQRWIPPLLQRYGTEITVTIGTLFDEYVRHIPQFVPRREGNICRVGNHRVLLRRYKHQTAFLYSIPMTARYQHGVTIRHNTPDHKSYAIGRLVTLADKLLTIELRKSGVGATMS